MLSRLGRWNRRIALAADAVMVLVCWHLTYLFRLGFERWQPGRPYYDDYVSLAVVLCYALCLSVAGVPRGLWRFFGFDDFRRITIGCLVAGLLSACAVLMLHLVGVARAVLVLHPLFCVFALCVARMAYRLLWEHANHRATGGESAPRRAIVLGAGESARRLVSSINRRYGWTVLALLDDDPATHGLRIAGVDVIGGLADLRMPHVLAGATHVIMALDDIEPSKADRMTELARSTGLTVLRMDATLPLSPDEE
jgi:FlaA1/EpsC-like NDP-sugar epimerase